MRNKIFVQAPRYEIGYASYHFESENSAFINWEKLSNHGLPKRKKFINTSFDEKNRIFTGSIDWSEEGGLNGENIWLYLIVFNEEYTKIIRGFVVNDQGGQPFSFSSDLNYIELNTYINNQAGEDEDEDEDEDARSLVFINKDGIYEYIQKINTIDNVGNFVSSLFGGSNGHHTETVKNFQSYVCKTLKNFRNEVIEKQQIPELSNDVATLELCAAAIQYCREEMMNRGVNRQIVERIVNESIRVLFNKDVSAIKLISQLAEKYELDDDESAEELIMNMIVRLYGSNIKGRVRNEYIKELSLTETEIKNFIGKITPGFDVYLKKMSRESEYFVDQVLNTRW